MTDADVSEEQPETDACDLDFTEDADDEETASLRPLFPEGNPNTEQAWRDLFSNDESDTT